MSPVRALLVGSTTIKTIAHSACPVVAWRGAAHPPTANPVLVGAAHDGTSHAALVTAFGLASRLGVGLRVVHAIPPSLPPGEIGIPLLADREVLEDEAQQRLSAVVAPLAEHWPGVDVRYAVETGRAGCVLLRHAAGVQFVGIGTRGRGNVARTVLGATGLHLLHHSPLAVIACPASYAWDHWAPGDDSVPGSSMAPTTSLPTPRHTPSPLQS